MKMKSEIWRVVTERIGAIEAFHSERDMQSFLLNNPVIVGCWDPELDVSSIRTLVRSEVHAGSKDKGRGRMDIVGLAKTDEGGYELMVFELKHGEINTAAVDQLKDYIKRWETDEGPKKDLKEWILGLELRGIAESNIDLIVDRPIGVLVGSRFLPEAIKQALELKLQGIRLARFRGSAKAEHEYFVIVEDQIGSIVSSTKKYWSWQELIDKGLIQVSDKFSISHMGNKLSVTPDPKFLDYNWIRVIFDQASRGILLKKEIEIRKNVDQYGQKWIDKALQSIKKGEGVWLSHATGLSYFAFKGPTASYWVPTDFWVHDKTGETLLELKSKIGK